MEKGEGLIQIRQGDNEGRGDTLLRVAIEHDEHGYFAHCPDLPGCQTHGDTYSEALANIWEAVELYLDTLDDGDTRA